MIALRLLLLAFAGLLAGALPAQRHRLVLSTDDSLPARWIRPIELTAADAVPRALSQQLAFLHGKGYLEASIDNCSARGDTTFCALQAGRPYAWARLSGAGIPLEIASQARFRESLFTGRPVAPSAIQKLIEGLLKLCEEDGHPFAWVRLDSLRHDADGLRATVRLERGRAVRIDSVVVKGTLRISPRYLQSHIGIREGDRYNEALIRALERRLRELPFVAQRGRPYVQFAEERTKLFLFLDDKRASSVNGVLGVQPDAITGKVKLTGDIDLRLRSALRRGEAIDLNWRSLADATQDLRVRLNLPFALNTPFGADASLKLFKRDSTFLEVTARGALEYLMNRGDKVSAFVGTKSSERLGRNLASAAELGDVRITSYGLGVTRERFDYRLNPRRGHSLRLDGSVGRKRTTTAVIGEAVPSPTLRSVQFELEGMAVAHLPIKRRSTLRFAAQGGWMVNDNLYRNELYRIGGLKTVRGADEASIFASAFAIGTIEYRFVYEENANFFVFFDQGWWEDGARADRLNDDPRGFGVGTTFETKAGLFGLTYALGQQFGNPIALRGGKVHFGFTSLF
ncbi:MAG: BamA/TamA family outer membrane protein [Flavobacteriales bacterium]|nr:BamA/TamA family outer membrane protein [Flavobacteriales bacterium]